MNRYSFVYSMLFAASVISCNSAGNKHLDTEGQIQKQILKLNELLQDSAFAMMIAKAQDSAYYTSQKQEAPPFPNRDSMLTKSLKEEKIAINLAGFYAVECGIGALMEEKGGTPLDWLQKIAGKKTDSNEVLLLNRFANATWKGGQPFRSLGRIRRDNFISANFLSESETKKDYDQVLAAATKLLDSLKNFVADSKEVQVEKMGGLLKDKQFAFAMAQHMESSYYKAENKPVPPFINAGEEEATIKKSALEEKLAINVAGFYALECGLSYMAAVQKQVPSELLQSIIDGNISTNKKRLLERFANATWKAGQPFRGLNRITRDNFTPFSLLTETEIEKDWVQIQTAAIVVKKQL